MFRVGRLTVPLSHSSDMKNSQSLSGQGRPKNCPVRCDWHGVQATTAPKESWHEEQDMTQVKDHTPWQVVAI